MIKSIKYVIFVSLIILLILGIILGVWCVEMTAYSKEERTLLKQQVECDEGAFLNLIDGVGCYVNSSRVIVDYDESFHAISYYKEGEDIKKTEQYSYYANAIIEGELYSRINIKVATPLKRSAFLFVGIKPSLTMRKETYKGFSDYFSENVRILDRKCKVESVGSKDSRVGYNILVRHHTKDYSIEMEFLIDDSLAVDYEYKYEKELGVAEKLLGTFVEL